MPQVYSWPFRPVGEDAVLRIALYPGGDGFHVRERGGRCVSFAFGATSEMRVGTLPFPPPP